MLQISVMIQHSTLFYRLLWQSVEESGMLYHQDLSSEVWKIHSWQLIIIMSHISKRVIKIIIVGQSGV
jgi:hypothetical protein